MYKILLVDDEQGVRDSFKKSLAKYGYNIKVASHAKMAIGMLQRENFDVVVTDIILPRISGVELLLQIRNASPETKVILITGNPTIDTATQAVRAGAFDYLVKPVKAPELIDCISSALKVKSLEEESLRYRRGLEEKVEISALEVARSEQKFRRIFEESPIGIMQFSETGKLLDSNRVTMKILGVKDPQKLESLNLFDNFGVSQEGRSDLETGGSVHMEVIYDLETQDGGESPSEHAVNLDVLVTSLDKVTESDEEKYLVQIRDITERSRMQTRLKDSEERFRALFEGAAIGMFILNLGGRIVETNSAAKSMLGYSREELKAIDFFDLIYPEDLKAEEDQFKSIVSGRQDSYQVDIRCVKKDGGHMWGRQNISLIKNYKDIPKYVIVMLENIDDREKSEKELSYLTSSLEDRIREMNCLYAISNLVEKTWEPLDVILPKIAQLIPMGWRKSDATYARIKMERMEFTTLEFKETLWSQRSPISVNKEEIGFVEVFCDLDIIGEDERAGLCKSGKSLLNAIAERLSRVAESKRIQKSLEYRLSLERLISATSTNFINMQPQMVDQGIRQALRDVGEFANVDRSYVFLFFDDWQSMSNTHEWCNKGIAPQIDFLQNMSTSDFPWWCKILRSKDVINIPSLDQMPVEAAIEKQILADQDIKSAVVVPMIYEGQVVGYIGLDSVINHKTWPEEDVTVLKTLAGIIASALGRKGPFVL